MFPLPLRRRGASLLLAAFSLLCAAALAAPAWCVEHPGVIPQGAECSGCHARKVSGKSVHSAMASPCTVCHLSETRGDMTTVTLSMPKEQICFSCHERSAALRQHVPGTKASCIECHDAHSSDQRMLLRTVLALQTPVKHR